MADRRIDPHLEVREARRGKRPGDAYVKIVRPYDEIFERGDAGELIATERTVLDRPGWTRALRRLRTMLIGRPKHRAAGESTLAVHDEPGEALADRH